jgi:predicted dehydrogenase
VAGTAAAQICIAYDQVAIWHHLAIGLGDCCQIVFDLGREYSDPKLAFDRHIHERGSMATNGKLNRKLRMALVGGGQGAFIGRVHVTAAILDNRATLVAGALSSDPAKSKASAPDYDIPAERAYGSYTELIEKEQSLPADRRVDFITIATPNHTHFPIAKAALAAGFNVICDKPMTFDLKQAEELLDIVKKSGAVFALTHNYTGYPLVRHARQMILGGELGEIQAFRSNYIQGWLRTRLESGGQKQAAWRTDPTKSGAAGCFGDIGTHAYNLARYMTGLIPAELSCNLKIFEPGRQLDDYGHAVIRFENGALGTVTASQISHGRENDLFIEVDGTKGSLAWRQEEPNVMTVRRNGQPHALYTRDPNAPFLNESGKAACRLPSGHPEAFFEAFANVYRFAYDDIVKRTTGEKFSQTDTIYPNVADGVDGMHFIQQCVASSRENGRWLPLKHPAARR